MQNFGIFITSNRLAMAKAVQESLGEYKSEVFTSPSCDSFAKLFNKCVEGSSHELNIIIGDKALATPDTINHILTQIQNGYALVAACGFACVGFNKELFRAIGPLDERFIGGSFEDSDYLTRLKHSNLALHFSWACHHIKSPSSWGGFEQNKQKYIEKWGTEHIAHTSRLLPDEYSEYNFGAATNNRNWLDFSHTRCTFEI